MSTQDSQSGNADIHSIIARVKGIGLLVLDPKDPALQERITAVINREGGAPESNLHSWRCSYPERYRKCDCVESLSQEIIAALEPDHIDKLQAQGYAVGRPVPGER